MSERVASCGSLYDSTNLLLQYCNNGELPLIPLHHTQQGENKKHHRPDSCTALLFHSEKSRKQTNMFLHSSGGRFKIYFEKYQKRCWKYLVFWFCLRGLCLCNELSMILLIFNTVVNVQFLVATIKTDEYILSELRLKAQWFLLF